MVTLTKRHPNSSSLILLTAKSFALIPASVNLAKLFEDDKHIVFAELIFGCDFEQSDLKNKCYSG